MASVPFAWQSCLSGHLLCLSPTLVALMRPDRTGGALLFPQDEKPPPTTLPWRTDHSSEKVKAESRVKRKQREKKRGRRGL